MVLYIIAISSGGCTGTLALCGGLICVTSTWSEKWGSYIEYVSCQMQKGLSAVHLPRESLFIPYGRKFWWEDILADC